MSEANASLGMDTSPLRRIEFTAALSELAGMIGEEVAVSLFCGVRFFGAGFHSRLELVETMPPDESAVVLRFEHGEVLQLDPEEVESFLGGRREGWPRWLEFHLLLGPMVKVEVVESIEAR